MSDFNKKKGGGDTEFINKTLPMPVTCDSCGFELPSDAESNSGYFVNQMICSDLNRQNKKITSTPGQFLKVGKAGNHERVLGDSMGGYHLKDNYKFVRWVVWCVRCHANKSRLQDMSKKTNNLISEGKSEALNISEALKKLNSLQNMKKQSKPTR